MDNNEHHNPWENALPSIPDVDMHLLLQHINTHGITRLGELRDQLQRENPHGLSVTAEPVVSQGKNLIIGVTFKQAQALAVAFDLLDVGNTDDIYYSKTPVYANLEKVGDPSSNPIQVEVVPIDTHFTNNNQLSISRATSELLKLHGENIRITEVYKDPRDIDLDAFSRTG